jgi:hypothetical protein
MKLSLRELFLLVALVAMGLGWWMHVRRLQAEACSLQRDLLMQADYVSQFVSVLNQLGCEIPPDSDPRCANGGPYTRIFVPSALQKETNCISFTLSGPREELQRTLNGEYGERFRAKVQ